MSKIYYPREKLGDCITLSSGKFLPVKNRIEGIYNVYGGNGVSGSHNDYFVEDPTIVIGRVGEYCGCVHISSAKSWITDNALFVTKFIREFDIRYLFYALNKENLNRLANTSGQPSISQTNILNTSIIIPPIEVQSNIANILDKTQEIIDYHKKQLEELDHLIKAIFNDMFGDPATNEKGWEVKNINQVSKKPLAYGSGASAIEYNGNIRYIRITDINENGFLNKDAVSPSEVDEKYFLNDGDILFARSGATVGKTLRFRSTYGKSIYAGYLIRQVPDLNVVLPDYIYYYTKTNYYKSFIQSNIKTVAQPNINAKQYGELKITVPPIELQNKFAKIVTNIEEQKSIVKQSLEQSQTLFNSLLSKYFDE